MNLRQMKLRLELHSPTIIPSVMAALSFSIAGCSFAGEEYEPGEYSSFAPDPEAAASERSESQTELETAEMVVGASETELSGAPSAPSGEGTGNAPTAQIPASESGSTESTPPESVEPPTPTANPTQHATLVTSGRKLLDTCGNPFVTRGVEQIFGNQLPQGNDWVGLIEQIAASGVNAVRILAGTDTLALGDVDALIEIASAHGMIAYVSPYGNDGMQWLGEPEVRAMLAKHERHIIIDAFGEPTFDDRDRFVTESTDAIRQVREWGYRVPLTVTANQFGRDLPSLLELGAEIVASDPLNNTVLGWQAYWSSSGYYQNLYGFSLEEAVQAVADAPFPIQLGLDRITDYPATDTADFGALLSATETHGIGWLWWDWYNPYGNENNLTEDGSTARLTPTGNTVINTHEASIQKTSKPACPTTP